VPAVEGEPGDDVPDAVREAARAAFGAGPPVGVVADLVFDSLLDPDPEPRLEGVRRLRFECAQGGAQLEVAEAGETVRVRAQVLPTGPASLEVRSQGRTFTVRAGENGAVGFDVRSGLVSLVIVREGAGGVQRLQTAWVRL
jgi:hypothetical protein